MAGSLSLEQRRKLAAIEETLKAVTEAIVDLRKSYSLLVDTQKQLVDVVKSGEYARDFKAVLDEIRSLRIQQQPNVLREVEEVTPTVVRKNIERKGLTSPNALILGVLNRTVSPTELVYSLQMIRAKQQLRGRVRNE
jgi:hypothetical protein